MSTAFSGGPWADAAELAFTNAPYLKRISLRRPDLLADADDGWAERLLAQALADAAAITADPPALEDGMRILRRRR